MRGASARLFWGGIAAVALLFLLMLGQANNISAAKLNVPTTYATIQAGIDAAVDGDVVVGVVL